MPWIAPIAPHERGTGHVSAATSCHDIDAPHGAFVHVKQATFVRYRREMELPAAHEPETIAQIIKTMTFAGVKARRQYGPAARVSHAKATGLLVGELEVLDGLAAELRQGLFAEPRRYGVVLRFAQGPGEVLDDKISTHRGVAIKVIGVRGAKIAEDDETQTQDFVLEAGKTFPVPDSSAFLKTALGFGLATNLPQPVKGAISNTAELANKALKTVGSESRKLDFFGHPSLHPLADAYFSQVPMRYGEYVAKIGLFPCREQQALGNRPIDASADSDAFRTALVDYARNHAVLFELRAQLATDERTMPLEDATVEWPEDESPYRTVARIAVPRQNAFSDARRAYFDDALAFRPAHSLVAHRPLGSVMRARLVVYTEIARQRHESNGTHAVEPSSTSDIPT